MGRREIKHASKGSAYRVKEINSGLSRNEFKQERRNLHIASKGSMVKYA